MAKSCKKCLLDTRVPGITIGHNGLCVYCNGDKAEPWDLRFKVTQEVKNRLRAELDNIFAENRGKYSYDCILALSGGKDSSYLLYQLVKERRLKVLAVHVKTIFESDAAAINIERLRDKLNFDLKKIYPGDAFYKELYSKLLLHPQNTNFIDSVCPICTEIWMG